MKFFLDTANVKEIQEAASLGLLDGVTTNPSLVAKEGRSFKEMLIEICNIVDGPISAEVVSLEADAMVKEGKDLAKIHRSNCFSGLSVSVRRPSNHPRDARLHDPGGTAGCRPRYLGPRLAVLPRRLPLAAR